MVSVVVPVYNEEKYLSQALSSLLTQSLHDWECIIVDDGSTDKSSEIIKHYCHQDSRFRVLSLAHNGVITALNAGFSSALGDMVCRFDSDDVMPRNRLLSQSKLLSELGAGYLISGKVKYFKEGGVGDGYLKYEKWLNEMKNHEDAMDNIFVECPVGSSTWLCSVSDIKKVNYFSRDVYPEDYDLVFKMLLNGMTVKFLDEVVLEWRDHEFRSSRISDFYSDQRFWPLKVKYFIEYYYSGENLWIWGTGHNGKDLYKQLLSFGVEVTGFLTQSKKKYLGGLFGTQVLSPDDFDFNGQLLIAVSEKGADSIIKNYLKQKKKVSLKDYFFFC